MSYFMFIFFFVRCRMLIQKIHRMKILLKLVLMEQQQLCLMAIRNGYIGF